MQGDTLAPFLFVIVLDYALRQAIAGKEEDYGLTIDRRRSRRVQGKHICDLDFADDIVLLSNEIGQAINLLHAVESECLKVGLRTNVPKTKSMFFNSPAQTFNSLSGEEVKQSLTKDGNQDFLYLGSWSKKLRDIQTRKALAWQACNKMDRIWKSRLKTTLKVRLFRATVETVLVFGAATWSLTKQEEKELDGTYTRLLRKVKNVSWRDRISNKQLYGDLRPISSIIRARRMRLAGHVFRDKSSPAHSLVTWQPLHGSPSPGRPPTTMVDTLLHDSGMKTVKELEEMMEEKSHWRRLVSRSEDICAQKK